MHNMKILVTNPTSELGENIVRSLDLTHEVKVSVGPFNEGVDTEALVSGVEAVIHSLSGDYSLGESECLDQAMRGTYNLISASVTQGVSKFIFIGSLDTMKQYGRDYIVTEKWRPVPNTEIATLCVHLAEFVCKEFAREKLIDVSCLRLGDIFWQGTINSSAALSGSDALQSIEKALNVDTGTSMWSSESSVANKWNVFHIQSNVTNSRFPTDKAESILGYCPSEVK